MFSFFSRGNSTNTTTTTELTILPSAIANPYFSNQTITPTYIVLHCTGYANPEAVWRDNQVSTHYFIPEQDNTTQLLAYEIVKTPLRARHAGVSHWKNLTNLNDYAIGIEIHMPNYARALLNDTLDYMYFQPYQQKQLQALILLIQRLQKQYAIPAANVIGHSDIAPWRLQANHSVLGKTDPGPTLPWQALSEQGIGVWMNESIACPQNSSDDLSATIAQEYLTEIGYAVENSTVFDLKTKLTVGAFRLHFMPACFNQTTGYADACFEQPFDASTLCAMYRLLDQIVRFTMNSTVANTTFANTTALSNTTANIAPPLEPLPSPTFFNPEPASSLLGLYLAGASGILLLGAMAMGYLLKSYRQDRAVESEGDYYDLDGDDDDETERLLSTSQRTPSPSSRYGR